MLDWLLHSWTWWSILIKGYVFMLIWYLLTAIVHNIPLQSVPLFWEDRIYAICNAIQRFFTFKSRQETAMVIDNVKIFRFKKSKSLGMKPFQKEKAENATIVTKTFEKDYKVIQGFKFDFGDILPYYIDNVIIGKFGVCIVENFNYKHTAVRTQYNGNCLCLLFHPANIYGRYVSKYPKALSDVYDPVKKKTTRYEETAFMYMPHTRLAKYRDQLLIELEKTDKEVYDLIKNRICYQCLAPDLFKKIPDERDVKYFDKKYYVTSMSDLQQKIKNCDDKFTDAEVKKIYNALSKMNHTKVSQKAYLKEVGSDGCAYIDHEIRLNWI